GFEHRPPAISCRPSRAARQPAKRLISPRRSRICQLAARRARGPSRQGMSPLTGWRRWARKTRGKSPSLTGRARRTVVPKMIDVTALSPVIGTMYPPPLGDPCLARTAPKLGDAAGLPQFGVNLLRLPPGAWSSQRHWQTASDEFVYVLSGEVTLVTNSGAELLRPGDCAGFKAGDADG